MLYYFKTVSPVVTCSWRVGVFYCFKTVSTVVTCSWRVGVFYCFKTVSAHCGNMFLTCGCLCACIGCSSCVSEDIRVLVQEYIDMHIHECRGWLANLLDLLSSVGRVLAQNTKGPWLQSHKLSMYLCCYYAHVFAVVHFVLTYVYMLGSN